MTGSEWTQLKRIWGDLCSHKRAFCNLENESETSFFSKISMDGLQHNATRCSPHSWGLNSGEDHRPLKICLFDSKQNNDLGWSYFHSGKSCLIRTFVLGVSLLQALMVRAETLRPSENEQSLLEDLVAKVKGLLEGFSFVTTTFETVVRSILFISFLYVRCWNSEDLKWFVNVIFH